MRTKAISSTIYYLTLYSLLHHYIIHYHLHTKKQGILLQNANIAIFIAKPKNRVQLESSMRQI